jgi:hypothetical protein
MAILAGDAAVQILLVIEWPRCGLDHMAGRIVTGPAPAEYLIVAPVAQIFEMAQETSAHGDGEVFTLHDLGVAAYAAELLATAELTQMRRVIETDFDRLDVAGGHTPTHASFQEALLMATASQTTGIGDLGVRLATVGSRQVFGYLG